MRSGSRSHGQKTANPSPKKRLTGFPDDVWFGFVYVTGMPI